MGVLADLIYGIRTIAQAGTDKPLRGRLNIVSGGTLADNPATGSTDLTITGAAPTVPTGTGLMSVTAGAIDAASRLVTNAYVDAAAAIAGSKVSPAFGAQNISTTGTLTAGASVLTSVRATALGTGVVKADGSGNFTSALIVNADVNAAAAIVASKLDLSVIGGAVSFTGGISVGTGTTTAGFINTASSRVKCTTITQADSPFQLTASHYAIAVNHGAAVSILLPTSPAVGDEFEIMDVAGVAATYNITIDSGTGNNIDGSQTFAIIFNRASYKLICWDTTSTKKWKIV